MQYGIGACVVSHLFGESMGDNIHFPSSAGIRRANLFAASQCRLNPGRLFFTGYVNPQNPDWLTEMERCAADGVCGIKLWVSLKDEQGSLANTVKSFTACGCFECGRISVQYPFSAPLSFAATAADRVEFHHAGDFPAAAFDSVSRRWIGGMAEWRTILVSLGFGILVLYFRAYQFLPGPAGNRIQPDCVATGTENRDSDADFSAGQTPESESWTMDCGAGKILLHNRSSAHLHKASEISK